MNQQIKKDINAILSQNVGNRMTEELILGMSARIITIVEKELLMLGGEIQSLNEKLQAGDQEGES